MGKLIRLIAKWHGDIVIYLLAIAFSELSANYILTAHEELFENVAHLDYYIPVLKVVMILTAITLLSTRTGRYGHDGWRGIIRSWLTSIEMTLVGAGIVGAILMPVSGAMYAPLYLMMALFTTPYLFIVLICASTLAHYAMVDQRLQNELRDDLTEADPV